jgi:hypothetical protein
LFTSFSDKRKLSIVFVRFVAASEMSKEIITTMQINVFLFIIASK